LTALKASADLDLAADLLANAEEEDAELAEQRIEDALEALLDAEIAGNDDDTVILSIKLSAYYLMQLLFSPN
jgi:plasmid stabilization system protein ParE